MKFSYARNRDFRRSKETYYFCILCKHIINLWLWSHYNSRTSSTVSLIDPKKKFVLSLSRYKKIFSDIFEIWKKVCTVQRKD